MCEQYPREANAALHIVGKVRPRELAALRMPLGAGPLPQWL